jgi:multicomponent Na+:H+ antiporter subunit D
MRSQQRQNRDEQAGERRDQRLQLGGGVLLLLAVAILHQTAGELDFVPGGFVAAHLSDPQILLIFVLFFFGFGTKAAILPLQAWLPTAMIAPTPVSALLHAVAVVKAGVFGFARGIGFVIGPQTLADIGAGPVLAALAAVTLVVGSLVALAQDELKARLAYSTIAHLSYIVLGLSVLSATAWAGGLLHIVYHGLMKITLFFCAGAIYVTAHKEHVSQLDGIGRRMPLTMAAFGLASIGLVGVPPMTGFWSKWFLVSGEFDPGLWTNIEPEPGGSSFLPFGVGGIFPALPFAVWFFLAIEGVPLAAEESMDPRRDVPKGSTINPGRW